MTNIASLFRKTTGNFSTILAASLATLAMAGAPALAQSAIEDDIADTQRYRTCLQTVITEPDAAYELALTWLYEAGGMPAMHCSAAALAALGHHEEAATRLEDAAITPDPISDAVRAELFAQAASAWMSADDTPAAIEALDSALAFSPANPELLIDRALAHAAAENYQSASEDLSLSLAMRPDDVLALRLRAQAWIELDQYELAKSDVDRALSIDENDIETLLIRGQVRQKLGL